jgi:hypothetical protein
MEMAGSGGRRDKLGRGGKKIWGQENFSVLLKR